MWTSRTFVTLWCNNKFILIHGFDELSENHIFMTKSFQQLNVHTFVSFPSVLICTYIIISIPLNFQLRHKHVLFIRLNFIQSNCFFFPPCYNHSIHSLLQPSMTFAFTFWLFPRICESPPYFPLFCSSDCSFHKFWNIQVLGMFCFHILKKKLN